MLRVPDPVIGEPVTVKALPLSVNATDVTEPEPLLLKVFQSVAVKTPVADAEALPIEILGVVVGLVIVINA